MSALAAGASHRIFTYLSIDRSIDPSIYVSPAGCSHRGCSLTHVMGVTCEAGIEPFVADKPGGFLGQQTEGSGVYIYVIYMTVDVTA